MTMDEARKAIAELKAQGSSDDQLIGIFYQMYKDNKIGIEEFEALMNLIGYHLSEEFLTMGDDEQMNIDNAQESENPEDPHGEKEETSEEKVDEEDQAMKLFGK